MSEYLDGDLFYKSPEFWDNEDGARENQEIEIRIYDKLRLNPHPRFLKYHGTDPDTSDIILDVAHGGNLLNYILRHPDTPFETRAKWGLQLAEGIAHLHSIDVVWCDCSPTNILLSRDLDILLCDFGGSSIDHEYPSVSASPWYALPALCMTDDPRMDIFSFGSVLYHILTLNMPYHDLEESPELWREIRARQSSGNFPVIPEASCGLYAPVIHKCWHLEYSSAQEVLEEMQTISSLLEVQKDLPAEVEVKADSE